MIRALVAIALLITLALSSCGPGAPTHDDLKGYAVPARAADQTHTVRGRVTSMPITGNPRTQFSVEHEAIPAFKNQQGEVIGMNHMDMHFPPAAGVDIASLRPGDVVEITFSVFWGEAPSYLLVSYRTLANDTPLNFDRPAPPR